MNLPMAVIRKSLTKPIWWYEHSRRYAIRERIFTMPPFPVAPDADTTLAVLTTPNSLGDAAWAAYSLLRKLPKGIGLRLVVDGPTSSEVTALVQRLFPGGCLEQTSTMLDAVRAHAPALAAYGTGHPLGRKLATILHLQQHQALIFSDADVLCFGAMPEVEQAIANNGPALYMQDVGSLNADRVLLNHLEMRSCEYAPSLNSGFVFVPHKHFSFSMAEGLLKDGAFDQTSWFTEQTIVAALMGCAQAHPLPRSRYIVSNRRQFYFETDLDYQQIAVRHFTTPVRHVLYSKGMPWLLQQLTGNTHNEA